MLGLERAGFERALRRGVVVRRGHQAPGWHPTALRRCWRCSSQCGSRRTCSSTSSPARAASTTSRKSVSWARAETAPARSVREKAKPMKQEKYEKALRKLQVRLCHLQDWVKEEGPPRRHRVRGPRRCGKGRDNPRADRAAEPARFPGGRVAGAVGPRKVAGLHAAIPAAFPRGGRSRHLRSELVQPRRGRVRHGLLLEEGARAVPRRSARRSRSSSSRVASR